MSLSDVDITVELAFGKGVGDTVDPSDWVDVSTYLVVENEKSPIVTLTTGRSAGDNIKPGTCSFALESADGRFNPLNTTGPYYGDLVPGIPIRLSTTYSSIEEIRWAGFVSSGWSQTFNHYSNRVEVTAHDILGILAADNKDWPDAYEDAVDDYTGGTLTHHWRPTATGWEDSVTGKTGSWTAAVESKVSPIEDSRDIYSVPFPDADNPPAGIGTIPSLYTETPTGDHLFSIAWDSSSEFQPYEVALGPSGEVALLSSEFIPAAIPFLQDGPALTFSLSSGFVIALPNADGDMVYTAGTTYAEQEFNNWATRLLADGAHTLLIYIPDGTAGVAPHPVLWLDGERAYINTPAGQYLQAGTNIDDAAIASLGISRATLDTSRITQIGTGPVENLYTRQHRINGWIDHIVTWDNVTSPTMEELDALAASLKDALLLRRVETLDGRIRRVADRTNTTSSLGTLDVSSFETGFSLQDGSPISHLQQIEDTEQGRVWVDRTGKLRFSTRQWSYEDTEATTTQLIASTDTTTLSTYTYAIEPLASSVSGLAYDPFAIVNRATVGRKDGVNTKVEDQTSINAYGVQNAVTMTNLLYRYDEMARPVAEWIVYSGKDPTIKIDRLAFRIEDDYGLAPIAQQIEEGWRVEWELTLPDGTDVTGAGHVVGMKHVWSHTGWEMSLNVDAKRATYDFAKWESTFQWDTGTRGWGF